MRCGLSRGIAGNAPTLVRLRGKGDRADCRRMKRTSEYSSPPIYTRRFLSGYTTAGDAYPGVRYAALSGASQFSVVYRISKSASDFSPGGGAITLNLSYHNRGATTAWWSIWMKKSERRRLVDALKDCGAANISLKQDGHYKLKLSHAGNKALVTIGSTPSDHRARNNMVSTIVES
jgi:hypothetical protein